MSYADRADEAQQEQLDWLHLIHEEEQKQTAHLARIAHHTAPLFAVAVLSLVLFGLGVLVWLYDLMH